MHKPTIQSLHNQHYHFTVDEPGALLLQYSKILKEWKFIKYSCRHCGNTYKTVKHFSTCKELNTTKRRNKEMPIQVIMVKGERMYRWGDSGKPYKNRADAEKQAQAAYASGYKEPMKQMKDKNK